MPRIPRYILPGYPQHVILRGNNRCQIFVVDEDYDYFRHCLTEACGRYSCLVHAYALMTNHAHLLATPSQRDSLSRTLQSTGRRYVQYFNATYQRTGTLWEGRYKATLIDAEQYLLTCHRYIELNPVRASLVNHPSDYRWSSYHANARGRRDSLIHPHSVYQALGHTAMGRQRAYQSLFTMHIEEKTLKAIREATQKGWPLGNDNFQHEIEALFRRRTRPLPRGGDHRSAEFRKGLV